MSPTLILEQRYEADEAHGRFVFALRNLGTAPVRPTALCYASMTRLGDDATASSGRIARRSGSHVEVEAPPGLVLGPGEAWEVVLAGLSHAPLNRTQGAMAAWVETADGPVEAAVGDLAGPPPTPPPAVPSGTMPPVALLPWPAEIDVRPGPPTLLTPPTEPVIAEVAALHRRLFPAAPAPFGSGGRPVAPRADPSLPAEGFALTFDEGVTLRHSDAAGLRHGALALAQMAHGARTDPRLGLPERGEIVDAPRFGWRGAHLDVARNHRTVPEVMRLIDLMAWLRMSHLHLHLTDDEGWRVEVPALPQLARVGGRRGRGLPLAPQYHDGPGGQRGAWSTAEARALVAHGERLGVTLVPEVDMPGHALAWLAAMPELRDAGETPELYRSVQGYADNALNPGLPATYDAVEAVLGALADLFPSPVIHAGGDEVDAAAWSGSPAALALAAREEVSGAAALQSIFMRRVQAMLGGMDRTMGGWDECAMGGGVEPSGALLFAWQSAARTASLVAEGYEVIATPGEAYYLDMQDRGGWEGAGTSWAGAVTPEAAYRFEVGPPEGPGRVLGVQACLWGEHLGPLARLDAAIHPRLAAVAEAGWSPPAAKSWGRFAALAPLLPRLMG